MKKWLVLGCVFLFGFLVATNCKVKKVEEVTDSERVSLEYYNSVSADNPFQYVDLDGAVSLLQQNGILYIGYPESDASKEIVSVLTEVCRGSNFTVSYFNPKGEEEKEKYQTLLDTLHVDELVIPSVYFVKDGQILLKDTSFAKENFDYYTKEEREKLKEKYQKMMDKYALEIAS